jgi:hypothetical protein
VLISLLAGGPEEANGVGGKFVGGDSVAVRHVRSGCRRLKMHSDSCGRLLTYALISSAALVSQGEMMEDKVVNFRK